MGSVNSNPVGKKRKKRTETLTQPHYKKRKLQHDSKVVYDIPQGMAQEHLLPFLSAADLENLALLNKESYKQIHDIEQKNCNSNAPGDCKLCHTVQNYTYNQPRCKMICKGTNQQCKRFATYRSVYPMCRQHINMTGIDTNVQTLISKTQHFDAKDVSVHLNISIEQKNIQHTVISPDELITFRPSSCTIDINIKQHFIRVYPMKIEIERNRTKPYSKVFLSTGHSRGVSIRNGYGTGLFRSRMFAVYDWRHTKRLENEFSISRDLTENERLIQILSEKILEQLMKVFRRVRVSPQP